MQTEKGRLINRPFSVLSKLKVFLILYTIIVKD